MTDAVTLDDLLAEDFDPRELPLYKSTCQRIEAAMLVAKDFGEEGGVNDQTSCDRAAEVLTLVQGVFKELEDNRKASTLLLRERESSIDDAFKEIRGPVEAVVQALKGTISQFNREEEERAAEAQAKLEEEAAEAQAAEEEKAAEEGRPARETRAPEVVKPETSRTTSTGATVSGTKHRKYEVTDFEALPDEFKKIDKGKLNTAARSGRDGVPGVRFYWDHGTSVRGS
jgi:hypothetical protein